MKLTSIIIGFSLLITYFLLKPEIPLLAPEYQQGHVKYVIDGDTLILSHTKERLRLWGVDAPELKEKGGQQSKIALSSMIQGKNIHYIKIEKDRYGRTVARVFMDEKEINKQMIANQHATEYCKYSQGFYNHC